MTQSLPKTIDEYIRTCAPEIQPALNSLRLTIRSAAPEAAEKISWGMATFDYFGNLVHFSAEKKHIGFHPSPSAIIQFQDELTSYRCSKGTIQLPYEKPLPLDLISRIVEFRAEEQRRLAVEKAAGKKTEREIRPRFPMPEDIAQRLADSELTDAYNARPPYQRNDYIGWIIQAKRPETREKRISQMMEELKLSLYMGMPYKKKQD